MQKEITGMWTSGKNRVELRKCMFGEINFK
jgi:hypothetical protein